MTYNDLLKDYERVVAERDTALQQNADLALSLSSAQSEATSLKTQAQQLSVQNADLTGRLTAALADKAKAESALAATATSEAIAELVRHYVSEANEGVSTQHSLNNEAIDATNHLFEELRSGLDAVVLPAEGSSSTTSEDLASLRAYLERMITLCNDIKSRDTNHQFQQVCDDVLQQTNAALAVVNRYSPHPQAVAEQAAASALLECKQLLSDLISKTTLISSTVANAMATFATDESIVDSVIASAVSELSDGLVRARIQIGDIVSRRLVAVDEVKESVMAELVKDAADRITASGVSLAATADRIGASSSKLENQLEDTARTIEKCDTFVQVTAPARIATLNEAVNGVPTQVEQLFTAYTAKLSEYLATAFGSSAREFKATGDALRVALDALVEKLAHTVSDFVSITDDAKKEALNVVRAEAGGENLTLTLSDILSNFQRVVARLDNVEAVVDRSCDIAENISAAANLVNASIELIKGYYQEEAASRADMQKLKKQKLISSISHDWVESSKNATETVKMLAPKKGFSS